MKIFASILVLLFSSDLLAFEEYYSGKNSKVILTKSVVSESDLSKYGRGICSKSKFCVLWFYSSQKNAELGTKAMKSGDMFASTPGMYAIYSKNKVANNVICYEPKDGC